MICEVARSSPHGIHSSSFRRNTYDLIDFHTWPKSLVDIISASPYIYWFGLCLRILLSSETVHTIPEQSTSISLILLRELSYRCDFPKTFSPHIWIPDPFTLSILIFFPSNPSWQLHTIVNHLPTPDSQIFSGILPHNQLSTVILAPDINSDILL